LRGDRAVDVQLVEPADVHHLIDLLEDVDEAAAVAQALVDRVLATLETAAHGAARLLALGTAPGGLPLAGPVTTADAGPLFPRSRRGLQIVQLHRVSLLYLYALASWAHMLGLVFALDPHQVAHLIDHAAHGRVVRLLQRLVQSPEPERPDRVLLILAVPDCAAIVGHPDRLLAHACTARSRRRNRSGGIPRRSATCSTDSRLFRARRAAWVTLIGLSLPSDFARMSWMPAASTTARTPAPAITPVPGAAGLSSTRAAPNLTSTSCGMVRPASGTRIMFFRAASAALRIESGTSAALPSPTPTRPLPSPTTTRL